MKKSLILLAGYPATGKTYLANKIIERHPACFAYITPDDMKEQVWDEVGFNDADDKAAVELLIWKRFYSGLAIYMEDERPIISDYPFSDKQKASLIELSERYGYNVLTVRLVGDPEVIYKRSLSRDLDPSRHLGHLVTRYHRGDVLEDRSKADGLVTMDILIDRCKHKGYDKFQLGELIEVDATDVKKIDYPALLDKIDAFLAKDGE